MAADHAIFSVVPIEVWLDKRLRFETMRVLGALLSFCGKDTNTVWPTRQSIAERCGLSPAKISEATSELVRLGWLKKDGRGGFSKATRYTIAVPRIVADSVTVPQSGTVTKKGTGGVPQSGTGMRVTEKGTGKELTNNKPEELTNNASRRKKAKITLQEFLNACNAAGENAISESDPVFEYADKIGLPAGYLQLGWRAFKDKQTPDKCQLDWRKTFRNYVRNPAWLGVWKLNRDGEFYLTDAGKQIEREFAGAIA